MKSDCMTIIVFHKYDRSLLSHFDEIFAMKRGKIIERGSFETLMQKRGSYVGIFVAIFVITWLVQYFVWKRKVKRMNDGVRKSNNAK